ncbi:MAG: hypothetical protein Q7R22_005700 [Verrucomicrobiota bacterium JB025]|nr:hypothetical protein [Verrucomicrobiota bacterium JB025]
MWSQLVLGVAALWMGTAPVRAFAQSELAFDGTGKSARLILGGQEFALSRSSGFRFEHGEGKDKSVVDLSVVGTSGNELRVAAPGGMPAFTFRIDAYDKHLAVHLLHAEGIGSGRDCRLSLVLDSTKVAAYTLNDMMTANTENRRRKTTELVWPYLWGRPRPNGMRGSVVLYDGTLRGKQKDAVLAEIWSVQGTAGHMVRPAGRKSWTEADVLAWVDRWVKKFSTISKVSIGAENPRELEEMTKTYVLPSGANRVYMFTHIWRQRGHGMTEVNTGLFPEGKADLLGYGNFLAERGIHLQLKSLSPQIDRDYAKYISPDHVDPRIMRWASGESVEDVGPSDTTILFRLEKEFFDKEFEGFMRIGNEIVFAKQIDKGNDGIWTLRKCTRGYGGSTAKSHKAGAGMAGCVEINGSFNFEDDFGKSNSLAEEICGEYGDFLNEVNVGHLHFDGTGRMDQYPWFVRDFTDYVYSRVDQPVTGSRVGGNLPANFEHQFSAAQAISGATGYRDIRIGPRLHQKGRKHTEYSASMLDLHFDVMDGVRLGSRRPSLLGGQSGASLSWKTLENYGLTDHAFQLFKYWVELAPVFDDADADYLAGFMFKPRGHHYQGEDVLVLGKNGQGKYIFTPHRVMGRTSGEDEPYKIDQEWGAVPRFQHIRAGTVMELLNPYQAQQPQVVIHVKDGSPAFRNPRIRVDGGGLAVTGEVEPNEYLKYEGGDMATVYDENWNALRKLPARASGFTVGKGNNTITTEAGDGSDKPELRVQFITLGPVYVLKTNQHL